jgi:hypothetical protein
MMALDFEYKPIENASQIRIMYLLPGDSNDTFHCILRHVDLEDSKLPWFDALSYVWGDPYIPKQPMRLSHYNHEFINISRSSHLFKEKPISASLASALQNWRNNDNIARALWVDAVCINQNDLAEREREVLKMCKIYSQAKRVLVWLGLPRELAVLGRPPEPPHMIGEREGSYAIDIEAGMKWTERLALSYDISNIDKHPSNLPVEDRNLWPSESELRGLLWLYQSPWFERIWVLQEVVLATGSILACCGRSRAHIGVLIYAAFYIRKIIDAATSLLFRVQVMRVLGFHDRMGAFREPQFYQRPLPERLLIALCQTGGFLKATVDHDQLYGLLGMILKAEEEAEEEADSALIPNYKKTRQNFLGDLARYLIEATGTAAVLQAWDKNSRESPSWLPTWKATTQMPYLPLERTKKYTQVRLSKIENHLHVNASAFGKLSMALALSAKELDKPSIRELLQKLEDRITKYVESNENGGLMSSDIVLGNLILLRTTTIGQVEEYKELYRIFLGHRAWPGALKYPGKDQAQDDEVILAYIRRFIGVQIKAIATSKGHFGFTWNDVNIDDVVYWIPGCRQPLVLRSCGLGYIIVGRCDLHGYSFLDEDEHFAMLEKGKWENITII